MSNTPLVVMINGSEPAVWKVHTQNMLMESVNNNPTMTAMRIPFQIFGHILFALGERCKEVNDPILNAIMMQLTIYTIADPECKDYRPEIVDEYMQEHLIPWLTNKHNPTPKSKNKRRVQP